MERIVGHTGDSEGRMLRRRVEELSFHEACDIDFGVCFDFWGVRWLSAASDCILSENDSYVKC